MKYLLRLLAIVAVFGVAFLGCTDAPEETVRLQRTGAGDAQYGGLFRMNVADDIRSIFPHNIVDAAAFNIMNQVYEGLVRINRETNEIVPSLAERYEVSADGKKYTFYLRKGVYFHPDAVFGDAETRELKAEDVAYCYTKLCEPSATNQLYALAIDVIKGGRDYYSSHEKGIATKPCPDGIKVVSPYVLEIELEFPMPNFPTLLTHPGFWIFPEELYTFGEEFDNWCIGTGPFKAQTIKMNDVIILERHDGYWRKDKDGNDLPFLDAVRCNFVKSDRAQLENFFEGNLDLIVQVPYSEVRAIESSAKLGDNGTPEYQILTSPGLRVEYYGMQHRSEIYGNELVRKAFNYAIDREKIVADILQGYGMPATYGFVPFSMPGYDVQGLSGYHFNADTAQYLLSQAGYPGGKGFPVVRLQVNDGNETALAVAEEVQHMLFETLNLTVELSALPRARHYDQIEQGKVDFWRDGWIADYPDPENFLKLFHGKLVPDDSVKASYLNSVRFKDDSFDTYFEQAMRAQDQTSRMELFQKADQVLLDKAAVIPLYYEKWIWLTSQRVHNLTVGSMGELSLAEVYLKNPKTEATLK